MSENTDNQGNKPNEPLNTDPDSFFQHAHPDVEEDTEEQDDLIPATPKAPPPAQLPAPATPPQQQQPAQPVQQTPAQQPGSAGVSPASQQKPGGFETDQQDWMPHSSENVPAINFNVGISDPVPANKPIQSQPASAVPSTNTQVNSPGAVSIAGQSSYDSFSSSSTQNPTVNVTPASPQQPPQPVQASNAAPAPTQAQPIQQTPPSQPQSFFEAADQPSPRDTLSRPQDAITQFFGDEKQGQGQPPAQNTAPLSPYPTQAQMQAPAESQPDQQSVDPNMEKLVQQPIFKNPGGVGDRPPLTAKPILPPRPHSQPVVQEYQNQVHEVEVVEEEVIEEETESPDTENESNDKDGKKSKRRVNLDKFEEVVKNPDFQALTQLLFMQAKEIVLHPQDFFSKPIEKGDITEPTIFLAACSIIGGLVTGFANINLFVTFRFVFISMLFTFVASFMVTKLATNYGSTKTFGENFRVMAYSQVSLLITSIQLGILSYVTGLLAMLYALYLQKLGMEQLHTEIPKTKMLIILGGVAVFLAIVGNSLPGKPY